MAAEDEFRLAELLCARLCHDLSGPIGGASAGAELLTDEDPPDAETAQLVADSVAAATRLLRVLRAALGAGTQPFAAAELEALARSIFPESGTTRLAWRVADGTPSWERAAGRLVLNLLMSARDALPRGGSVAATLKHDLALELVAEGPQVAADELAGALAATTTAGLTPRGSQGYYAARLAGALGRRISLAQSAGRLLITVG